MGFFDFNGDGKTTWDEEFLAFKMFNSMSDTSDKYEWRTFCEDGSGFGIDPEEYEDEDEYKEALEKAKYGWRDTCEDGFELDVYPEEYETEDEYNEALEEAKYGWRNTCEDGSELDVNPEEYETEDEYNEALEEASANNSNVISIPVSIKLSCSAFNELDKIKEVDYPNKRQFKAEYTLEELNVCCIDEYDKAQKARCKFILDKADTVIAAKYLTHNGDFLYSQAIKDNFKLPVTLPDEDETREFGFLDILKKIERKDIPLCFAVWSWCLDHFLDYAEYDACSRETLTNYMLDNRYNFSDEFMTETIKYMSENPEFRKKVVRQAEQLADSLSDFIVEAIKLNLSGTAKALFEDGLAAANNKWKPIIRLTNGVIASSENYEELETIEYVEQELLPLVRVYTDPMITDEMEVWEKDIAQYKLDVELSRDKYACTRGNAWRQKERYKKEAEKINLPSVEDDTNIYIYCGVALPFSSRPYSFRTNDANIKIGDAVIVPIGEEQKETKGTVVSVGQFLRIGVPYPVEKTKFILRRANEETE